MENKTIKRCDELFQMGMKFHFGENSYVGKEDDIRDMNVHAIEITCDSDQEWEEKVNSLKEEIKRRRSNGKL